MKKMVFALALIALAFGGSAFAQMGWQDNIGVYFDAEGTQLSATDELTGPRALYIVLDNLSNGVVDGFECKLVCTGSMSLMDDVFVFPVQTIEVARFENEILAAYSEPQIPAGGKLLAGTIYVNVLDAGMPGALYLEPLRQPSIEGAPCYAADGVDYALRNSTEPGAPVLVLNYPEEPVATETTSFDNLKSLFR